MFLCLNFTKFEINKNIEKILKCLEINILLNLLKNSQHKLGNTSKLVIMKTHKNFWMQIKWYLE